MKFYSIAQGASEFSGFKLDIWSSGITLYNFITGTYPFEGETIFRLFENIAKGDFEVPRNDVDQLLETLLRGMLASTPEDRLTLVQVRGSLVEKNEKDVLLNGNNVCSLSIARVSRKDHGLWMCLLNDITEFDTVRNHT